jgi:L-alanine-DL-glutamate epimerase-like enolase superfamily enzyme
VNGPGATITGVTAAAYEFPTPQPQSDGTLTWSSTVAVTAQVTGGGLSGLGWSYTGAGAATIVETQLVKAVTGRDVFDVAGCWEAMVRACRNLGRPGLVSAAIAAVDIAIWDLKARLLELSLPALFGRARHDVPVYGSGGFTNLTEDQLVKQCDEWLAVGCRGVKIKVGEAWGTNTARDLARTATVRDRVGPSIDVMVDANGGYALAQAVRMGRAYDDLGVSWFEEPVSSDDLAGLALLRRELSCDIAAGEYADSTQYVLRMCAAGAVDCLQVDVTRCAGYTEWLRCAAIAAAHGLHISGHCAPALHAPVAVAIPNLRHVEWFVDHARLEPLLVDGAPAVEGGVMVPGNTPGHGMQLKHTADRYRIS